MITNYIVYHDNCMDGFISAMLMLTELTARHQTTENILMVPANYGDTPIQAKAGDTLWIVDFSYPSEHIQAYLNKGVSVGIFDHHSTSINELKANIVYEDVESLTKGFVRQHYGCTDCNGSSLFGRLMENGDKAKEDKRSGAGIVLDYYMSSNYLPYKENLISQFCGTDIKKTVEIAQVHDLWLHDGDHFHEATYLAFWFKDWRHKKKEVHKKIKNDLKNSFSLFHQLAREFTSISLESKIAQGKVLLEENLTKIREECKKAIQVKLKHSNMFENCKVGFIPGDGPKTLGISLTGSILVKEFGFDVAIMTAIKEDGRVVYSLRSDQNTTNIDVAYICSEYYKQGLAFSGGGHRNAAGVTFAKEGEFFETVS